MARPSSDVDPKALDVAAKPRRRRKRNQPDPHTQLKAGKSAALARALKRPIPPGVLYEREGRTGDPHYVATSVHSDQDIWELQLADAFATRSQSVIRAFMDNLKALCGLEWDEGGGWKPNETEMNATLAMVADVQPRSVAEAALAAQMVAVHLMTMKLSAQALNRGRMIMEQDAALAGKLARTYVMQIEALQGLRGKRRTSRQTITVKKELHQAVHYHDHRGSYENERQPHEPSSAAAGECPTLSGDEPRGKVLRLPSR